MHFSRWMRARNEVRESEADACVGEGCVPCVDVCPRAQKRQIHTPRAKAEGNERASEST